MGEAKRRRETAFGRELTKDEMRRHVAAAQARYASGREGFAPDFGQTMHAQGRAHMDLVVIGVRFVNMAIQAGTTELTGFTYATLEGPEERKYAVTVATRQNQLELQRILRDNPSCERIMIRGKLEIGTVTGDSGEVYRRIIGTVGVADLAT
jgi:hypothetical protein